MSSRGMDRGTGPGDDELLACARILQRLAEQPEECLTPGTPAAEVRTRAGRLLRAIKDLEKQEGRQRDRDLLDATQIRSGSGCVLPAPTPLAGPVLSTPRRCYVCKEQYDRLHFFYDYLCPPCGDLNYSHRLQRADLTGRVALVTGGRVKIGYHVVLGLLRAGAAVIVTTRFPHDAARRFSHEEDFTDWSERLTLHGLDLRHLPSVERFADALLASRPHLDILVNNAAQTVRRPPAFYKHLLDGELEGSAALPLHARRLLGSSSPLDRAADLVVSDPAPSMPLPALLSQLPFLPGDDRHDPAVFPPGQLDPDGQQVDLRGSNSWSMPLAGVETWELLEVHAVNCLAPFILLSRLEPLLRRRPDLDKYVVNVSAMEGQLNSAFKTGNHPHTNMAKAALNMITRTCAARYAEARIWMNSVDTGWITNEAPAPVAQRMHAEGFRPPLDVIDGAARVLEPIFTGIATGQNVFGKFLKDYREIPW
jgi:NAD(P)-dependent dehydrogenase (short-subunit alcohol dehydrogenase family)